MATDQIVHKTTIPIVAHLITDDDLGIKKGVKLQPVSFSNVIKLLTDPHSITLHNRHTHALQRLVHHYQHGFLLKDLVQVFKVLNVMADRVSQFPLYLTPMIDILKLCSLPFLRQKSSDECTFSQISVESLSQIAYLVRVPSREVRKQLAETLLSIYTTDPPMVELQDLVPVSRAFNIQQINLSDIAETLTKSLPLFEVDMEVKMCFLDVLQHLSSCSPVNCRKMINVDGVSRILGRLNDQEPSGKLLYRSIEILLNLLEFGEGELVANQLNSFICISALRDAFLAQMTQGYSHYDRQLRSLHMSFDRASGLFAVRSILLLLELSRNDLLVLVSLAASHCPHAPFIESGFAKQLILFATFQEVRSHNMLVKHLKLSTNHEDFELKKLLMNVIVVLSKEPAMIPLLVEGHFLLALLSYVRNNEETSQPQEWSPSQFEELQLHAMSSLCTIAPQCVQDYMSYQGNTRLLLLLEWCVGKDDYGGHGNSYHASGGRGNKRAQMRYCMQLMRSMVSTSDEACHQDLVDQGAISQLLDILSSASRSTYPDDEVDVEMQCDMLFILSALCEGDLHRKELFGSKGVEALVQYLQVNGKKICNGLGHHQLMVACVDCIWSCVIGASINEDILLAGEGVFLLMNLLQSCPADMYNLVLGCLVDLCENPKSVSHLMAWRGQGNRTACNLLVDIWRSEETAIGVKRDANGFIADPANPLMGTLQAREGVESQPADCSSRAILDVFENLRAKVYSLFCKIGFADLPGLSTNDLVTLSIIEKYLELKSGEVWDEVLTELEQEGIRPVTPDQEAMEVMARAATERVNAVMESQEELLESQHEQDLLDEQDMYAEIRDNHKQKEKAMTDWNEFVARTSNYSMLKIAKDMQKTSIDVSRTRLGINENDVFHTTDLPHLQTTTFQGRSIAIASTPLSIAEQTMSFSHDKEVKLKERSAVFV